MSKTMVKQATVKEAKPAKQVKAKVTVKVKPVLKGFKKGMSSSDGAYMGK